MVKSILWRFVKTLITMIPTVALLSYGAAENIPWASAGGGFIMGWIYYYAFREGGAM